MKKIGKTLGVSKLVIIYYSPSFTSRGKGRTLEQHNAFHIDTYTLKKNKRVIHRFLSCYK